MCVIPVLRRQRQEDYEFKANLGSHRVPGQPSIHNKNVTKKNFKGNKENVEYEYYLVFKNSISPPSARD
jgi:hypothetical protein